MEKTPVLLGKRISNKKFEYLWLEDLNKTDKIDKTELFQMGFNVVDNLIKK
jgi:hypothetical protein